MAEHPWHPRAAPFLVYILFLAAIDFVLPHAPAVYPLLYAAQCGLVLWLIWRYRKLMPELTLSFDWLALVTGVAVFVAWVVIGKAMVAMFPEHFAATEPHAIEQMDPVLRHTSMGLQLIGMSVIVPLLEEPFVRSMVLRSMHRLRPTAIAAVQLLADLPLIGDWFMHTDLAQRADKHPRVMGDMFDRTPLGKLSVFGVFMSTLIFTSYHLPRDWPAAVVCGIAYCLLLAATSRKGLGPVIWAHGITNALLWAYTLRTGDWQFL
jgi:membrane protease YdiL (CAAX protease family)